MKYSVTSFLRELLDESIIDEPTANRIEQYYSNKSVKPGSSRLLAIFGILGAFLVGSGIILIVAHNWDELSRSLKCTLSFIPVFIGLASCFYSITTKPTSFTWKEGSSIFLTLSIGACIGLISQVYNIPGSLADFMLTWSLLTLPIVYLLNSSITSLFFITGITSVGLSSEFPQAYYFWALLLLITPFYFSLFKVKSAVGPLIFHHWFIPLAIMLNVIRGSSTDTGWLVFPTLMILFGFFYLISQTSYLNKHSLFQNGYRVIGSIGSVIVLLATSFKEVWEDMARANYSFSDYMEDSLIIIASILALLSIGLATHFKLWDKSWMNFMWIIFLPIFILGFYSPSSSTILINFLLLIFSILVIKKGIQDNHLGIINYGLITIVILVLCRFFDINIPFVLRGIIFIVLGLSFFLINYKLIQDRKKSSHE